MAKIQEIYGLVSFWKGRENLKMSQAVETILTHEMGQLQGHYVHLLLQWQ